MKSKTRIISIMIIVVLFLNLLFLPLIVLAKESDSTAVITGTYNFSSNEENNIQKQNTFKYRDDCFTRSSFIGCKHLEILSIQVSSASVSWYGETTDIYDIDPSQNAHNITKMLEDMKFKNVATNRRFLCRWRNRIF